MPIPELSITIAIQIAVVIHILKTGRSLRWIFLIVFLPLIGSVIYLVMEVLPELSQNLTVKRARNKLTKFVNPGQDLRRESQEYRRSQSIDSTRKYADELCQLGRYDEAIELYESGLKGMFENDPTLLLGLSKACFQTGDFTRCRQLLDRLTEHNPEFKSADGHLLYARALESEGNTEQALSEYAAVSNYYPGVEARLRHAQLLQTLGQLQEARDLFKQILEDAELAPKHFRRSQKRWLDEAGKGAGSP
jgi:hypothetical protein